MTMHTARNARLGTPVFLPLAVGAAHAATTRSAAGTARATAELVEHRAVTVDAAASECWTTLLAGCRTEARQALPARLRELTEAISGYLGPQCWFNAASPHRLRVTEAEERIVEAIQDSDGAEFAAAFAGYDQVVATAVASVPGRAAPAEETERDSEEAG